MSALADVRGGRPPVGIRWLARIAAVIGLVTLTGCVIMLMSLHSTPLPPLESTPEGPLLTLTSAAPAGGCSVAIAYAGGRYCVPRDAKNTHRVFDVLATLVAMDESQRR
jgi:hypothetical protein